jgi:PucR C-terminal helix-turn-helix domain/GGDEF-like domain
MPHTALSTLGGVLAELGEASAANDDVRLAQPVRAAMIWLPGDPLPTDPDLLIVCPTSSGASDLTTIAPLLADTTPRMIVITAPLAMSPEQIEQVAGPHHVVSLGRPTNAADIVAAVTRTTESAEESVSRRLASLQRTFSQALAEQAPVPALLTRVKRVTNAAVTIIDTRGATVHTTAPVPLSKLYEEIRRTSAESQSVDIDGWHGIATRINDPSAPDRHFGWLMAVSRRDGFPDSLAMSAVHIAATLIEASQQMAAVARTQERAVRATVFNQALALRPQRGDAELAGRITSLGISFGQELRVIAVRPLRSLPKAQGGPMLRGLSATLEQQFKALGVAPLITVRDNGVALLAQCSAATANRFFIAQSSQLPASYIGIGRIVKSVGDVADSYHDAQLAVRALRRRSDGPATMAYEDFDFATRLLADVGLDEIAARAEEFLRPIENRETLAEGLRTYFEHGQNINSAADALNIHHNSLRYRLSKIEELLSINLKEPAAISSVFLALTALELTRLRGRRPRASGIQRDATRVTVSHIDAPGTVTELPVDNTRGFGVAYGPDR